MLRSARDRFEKMISYDSENGLTGILYGKSSVRIIDRKTGIQLFQTSNRASNSYLWLVDIVEHFQEERQAMLSALNWDDDAPTNI